MVYLFYQSCWDLVKVDFMALVRDFENGTPDIYRLNCAIITLIPKKPDAKEMIFCHVSLSDCDVKIFTKAMTLGLQIYVRLISPNETTFKYLGASCILKK